jgi:hypothetical protein
MAEYQDLQDLNAVLKPVFLPVRKKVFPLMTPGLAAAKRGGPDRVKYTGEDLFFVTKLGRRPGFVASASGFLPESATAKERKGRLGIARTYFTVQVDGLADAASQTGKGAYISSAKKLTEDVMDQWGLEQTRILYGDSMGVRALVVSKTSDTIWVVSSPYGIASSGPGNLWLEVGDTIALLDSSASDAVLGKAKITAITLSGDNATITVASDLDGAGVGAAGDKIVTAVPTATDSSDTSYGAEPHGWKSFVDVEAAFATFENLNDSRWVAQKLTSTTVDETILMKLLLTIRSRAGIDFAQDAREMLLFTSPGIWQTYGNSLLGLRRFSAPEMTLKGGFTGVGVAGAVLRNDPWAPRGRIYAIHTPSTIFVDLLDFGMRSLQDAPRWQRASNRDAWEGVFAAYWNYGLTNRTAMGVISGITDSTNYSPIY